MNDVRASFQPVLLAAATVAMAAAAAPPAAAQWTRTHEQFYLPASHNWVFRDEYPVADRLFNAFDYGHAILYEELWRNPRAPVSRLEQREYGFITRSLLVRPPRVPVAEQAVAVEYVKLVPEVHAMFHWAHLLHRQLYDVLADERLGAAETDAAVAELLRYYRSRPDLAFSSRPKEMALMEGRYYSTAFREAYPKFNGLIWAYHWLQVGLYEPLLVGRNRDQRQTGVALAVTRFRQMLEDPPSNMPRVMPMTAAVAPTFTARYPEAAIVFDNLHSMHDVISDILASPEVPREHKRAEILRAAELYRDDVSHVMTVDAWRQMAVAMGVENQGGPVLGILAPFPEPTAERGVTMEEMEHAHDAPAARDAPVAREHEGHAAPAPPREAPARDHAHHAMPPAAAGPAPSDSAEVASTVDRYHRALAEGDSAAAAGLLLPDVTVLESGRLETRDEYLSHHLPADMAFAAAVPRERDALRVTVQGDVAWVASTSAARGEFRGRPVDARGAELMVLVRTPEGWRIAAIHWSSRPAG